MALDTTVEEMTQNDMTEGVTIRLLNGILCGCEFHLPQGKTPVLIYPMTALADQAEQHDAAANTIFIPATTGAGCFEIEAGALTEHCATLYDLSDTTPATTLLSNTIYEMGGVSFSVKANTENWSEIILAYSEANTPVPIPAVKKRVPRKHSFRIACVIVLLLSVLATSCVVFYKKQDTQQQINQLSARLRQGGSPAQVLYGRDKRFYIFTQNGREALQAKKILMQHALSASVQITTYQEETQRVTQLLDASQPPIAYYSLKLGNPTQPMLVLSRDRMVANEAVTHALQSRLTAWMPYADKINITTVHDADIIKKAQQGLDALAVHYEYTAHALDVNFLIHGAWTDNELQRIEEFIENFRNTWGTGYIQFSIELKDEHQGSTSFMYGQDGYHKITPLHWYFSNDI